MRYLMNSDIVNEIVWWVKSQMQMANADNDSRFLALKTAHNFTPLYSAYTKEVYPTVPTLVAPY